MKPWVCHSNKEWAEAYTPEPNTVCISISEPTWVASLKPGFRDTIRLMFDDLVKLPDATKFPSWEEDYRRNWGRLPQLMSKEQARDLANFLKANRGSNILVHCAAGISRSAAVAEVVLEAFPEYEDAGDPTLRHANRHVKNLLKRAMGLVPIGANEDD